MGTAQAAEAAWTCPAQGRAWSRAQIPVQGSGAPRAQLRSGQHWAMQPGQQDTRKPRINSHATSSQALRWSLCGTELTSLHSLLPAAAASLPDLPGSCLKCRAGPLAGERVTKSGGSGAQQVPWVTSLIGHIWHMNPTMLLPEWKELRKHSQE